jgi:uncharacterized protein (DUF1697 family)
MGRSSRAVEVMAEYVALLRGVNVGGHLVPMEKLRKTLERAGYRNVRTILASGNAVFEAEREGLSSLTRKLESALSNTFGFSIPVLLRTKGEIKHLVESEPFKGIEITHETGLYVTFLSDVPARGGSAKLSKKDLKIVSVTDGAVCSVVRRSRPGATVDFMSQLEREFGKNITTRNWNTIEKIARVLT